MEVVQGCPSGGTSNIKNFFKLDNVCQFECTFGVGSKGFSTGTMTNTVFYCCEGYSLTVLSPILDIYKCE